MPCERLLGTLLLTMKSKASEENYGGKIGDTVRKVNIHGAGVARPVRGRAARKSALSRGWV